MSDRQGRGLPLPKTTEHVVEQVSELREEFRSYQEGTRDREYKRRRENVQVLIALGAVGGYFSISANNPNFISAGISELLVQILVGISGLFLFAKMTTITLRPDFHHRWIEFVDEVVEPWLYAFSIFGLIAVGGITIVLNNLERVPERLVILAQGALFSLVFFSSLLYLSRVRLLRIVRSEEYLRNELAKTLALLENEDAINEAKSSELSKRFARVFTKREDLRPIHTLSIFGNGEDLVFDLNSRDRRRLNTLSERIRIKLAEGNPVSEDVLRIEEILEDIEER